MQRNQDNLVADLILSLRNKFYSKLITTLHQLKDKDVWIQKAILYCIKNNDFEALKKIYFEFIKNADDAIKFANFTFSESMDVNILSSVFLVDSATHKNTCPLLFAIGIKNWSSALLIADLIYSYKLIPAANINYAEKKSNELAFSAAAKNQQYELLRKLVRFTSINTSIYGNDNLIEYGILNRNVELIRIGFEYNAEYDNNLIHNELFFNEWVKYYENTIQLDANKKYQFIDVVFAVQSGMLDLVLELINTAKNNKDLWIKKVILYCIEQKRNDLLEIFFTNFVKNNEDAKKFVNFAFAKIQTSMSLEIKIDPNPESNTSTLFYAIDKEKVEIRPWSCALLIAKKILAFKSPEKLSATDINIFVQAFSSAGIHSQYELLNILLKCGVNANTPIIHQKNLIAYGLEKKDAQLIRIGISFDTSYHEVINNDLFNNEWRNQFAISTFLNFIKWYSADIHLPKEIFQNIFAYLVLSFEIPKIKTKESINFAALSFFNTSRSDTPAKNDDKVVENTLSLGS